MRTYLLNIDKNQLLYTLLSPWKYPLSGHNILFSQFIVTLLKNIAFVVNVFLSVQISHIIFALLKPVVY
jgi:hypothetical protein